MRLSAVRGRVFFLVTAVAAACSPSEFSAGDAPEAGAGAGGSGGASGGKGGTTGSGGLDDPSTGGSMAGGSSVGGGRGVVAGAAGMGAYGGKPPIGAAGANVGGSGLAASGGTAAVGGGGAAPGTGGADAMGGSAGTGEPGSGGAGPMAGGVGGDTGASGMPGAAGVSGSMGQTGGGAGTSGGTMGQTGGTGGVAMTGGSGGGGKGGNGATGGTGGATMTGGTGGVTPIGGCNDELLVNAGFESGKGVGWTETSDWPGIDLVVNEDDAALNAEGVSPYAGSFLAWLGGIPDNEWDHHITLIEQHVVIPAAASSLTLSGRHLVTSIDDPSDEYDEAYLEFDLNDEVVWQSLRLTNQSTSNGWVSFSKTTNDLEGLAGQTLLFYAYARTDLTGKTSFFLDSLSLVAGCGR